MSQMTTYMFRLS